MTEHQKNQVFLHILRPVALYLSVAATAGVGAVGALYLQSGKGPSGEENPAVGLQETQFDEFSSPKSSGRKSKPSATKAAPHRNDHASDSHQAESHVAASHAEPEHGVTHDEAGHEESGLEAKGHASQEHASVGRRVPKKASTNHSVTDDHTPSHEHTHSDPAETPSSHLTRTSEDAHSADETHSGSDHSEKHEASHDVASADGHTEEHDLTVSESSEMEADPFSEEALGFAEQPPESVVHPVPDASSFEDAESEDYPESHADASHGRKASSKRLSAEELFAGEEEAFHNAEPELQASAHGSAGGKESAPNSKTAARNLTQEKITLQAANLLTYADEQLAGGNYIPAMRALQQIRAKSQGPPGSSILFRLALCAEAAGRHAAALEAYRRISGTQTDPAWAGVSRYGEARCLAATGRHEGLQTDLLRRAILDETELLPTVRNEVLHLIGRDIWRENTTISTADLLKDTTLAAPEWVADPGQLLKELPLLIHESPTLAERSEFRVLSLSDNDPSEIRVRLNCGVTRIEPLMKNLIKGCRLKFELSEAAVEMLQGRSQQIHVADRSLALLLDGLTLPYELVWSSHDDVVQIRHRSEVSEEEWRTSRLGAAERILRHAVIDGPTSTQAGHSRLALSTLLFEQKRAADAVQYLQVQLETDPRSAVETETAFNLGKCLMLLNEREDARQAFLRSIDASGGLLDVRIAAYIFHSRLLVEDGKGKTATTTMMRGLSLAKGSELEPWAALQLASVYLMLDNPQGANSVLMGRREEIAEGPGKSGAAFISALSRFRAAVLSDQRERAGRDVVSALSEFRAQEACGGHWAVLVAEACDDLGLTEQALDAWRLALKKLPPCQLRNEAVLRLSQRYEEEGQYEEAQLLLTGLNDHSSETSIIAKLHTAELALDEKDTAQAIRMCRAIIDSTDDVAIERQALRIMGRAYESRNLYEAAVTCFAGMLPPEDASTPETKGGHMSSDHSGGH
ncbi:MAG: tetratricopeptide repeat protein [Planctomycetaceae bacterium]